jgi:SAM-dependent methyltransferase
LSERWQKYLAESVDKYSSNLAYAIQHWTFYAPMYHHIQKVITPPAKILEIGCGYGFSLIYLAAQGYSVTGIDNDPIIVDTAQKNIAEFKARAEVEVGDIFDLSRYENEFDLVFSIGLVEHFDREVTVELLRKQAACAAYVMAIVPSKYTFPITDERLYTVRQFCQIFSEVGLQVVARLAWGDVPKLRYLRLLLPHGLFRFLQQQFTFGAMSLGCLGMATSKTLAK